MKKAQQVLISIVENIVSNKDEVKVTEKVDEMGVLLTLKVHKEDMGMVIGREGSTIKAIRTIVRVIGMTESSRINLKVEEPEGSDRVKPTEEKKVDNFGGF